MLHSIGVVWVTKEQFELDKKVNFFVEKQFQNVVLRVSLGFQQQLNIGLRPLASTVPVSV